MDNNTEILNALKLIPELLQRIEQLIEDNASLRELIAEVLKKRIEAEVPDEQLKRIASVAANAVAHTSCTLPDPGDLSQAVAQKASSLFHESIQTDTAQIMKKVIKDTPLTVEHHHTHASLYEITKLAGDKARKAFITLSVLVALLISILVGAAYAYYTSDVYWGKRYAKICRSPYITDDEQEALWKDIYALSALPAENQRNPSTTRKNIKRYEEILEQRRAEARTNKGKYTVRESLKR